MKLERAKKARSGVSKSINYTSFPPSFLTLFLQSLQGMRKQKYVVGESERARRERRERKTRGGERARACVRERASDREKGRAQGFFS